PGQPARRRHGGAQADPQGAAARLPALWPLGADRSGRRVPRGRPPVPQPACGEGPDKLNHRRFPMIDIKSMGYVGVASTDLDAWKLFAGKVLGLAEGRGPHPDHQYWRFDEVSARIVVFPADVDQLACSGWEVADHQALPAA